MIDVNWVPDLGFGDVTGPSAVQGFRDPDYTNGRAVPGGNPPIPNAVPSFGLGGIPTSSPRNVGGGFVFHVN